MTSGTMKCPKCKAEFPYAGYVDGVWTETPPPWECPKCKSLIELDKEKGYGLRVVVPERA